MHVQNTRSNLHCKNNHFVSAYSEWFSHSAHFIVGLCLHIADTPLCVQSENAALTLCVLALVKENKIQQLLRFWNLIPCSSDSHTAWSPCSWLSFVSSTPKPSRMSPTTAETLTPYMTTKAGPTRALTLVGPHDVQMNIKSTTKDLQYEVEGNDGCQVRTIWWFVYVCALPVRALKGHSIHCVHKPLNVLWPLCNLCGYIAHWMSSVMSY